MKKTILVFIQLICFGIAFSGSIQQYTHKAIHSFEGPEIGAEHDPSSSLTISKDRFKHLSHSLKWSWSSSTSSWSIHEKINYISPKTASDPKISTFVFWIYSEQAEKEGKLKVEFMKDGEVATYFEYGLNFSGWRGAWIAFDRDMEGIPLEGMDEVRFSVPGVPNGTLYFDHLILSSMQDARYHTADLQAPFINPETDSHWLILNKTWNAAFDLPLKGITPLESDAIETIEQRVKDYLLKNRKATSLNNLRNAVEQYQITLLDDGSTRGVPVFFERYGETYESYGAARYNLLYNNIMGLSRFNRTLLNLSLTYNLSNDSAEKREIEDLYIKMIHHMLDQGFQAGSAMGTLHHLGYSMRDYYPAIFLMSEVLARHNLKEKMQQAMEWFAGTGDVKQRPLIPGMDVDTFNTNLMARLTSILMIDSKPEKCRYLHAFSRWLENGYQYADGTRGTFKIDGTMFHHRHHYPAYAVGGLHGAVEAIYLLRKSPFRISEQSHRILKNALLSMRIYSNLRTWPLSLSGRHPDGEGELIPSHFGLLALAGSPDGKKEIDPELAGAYLRLLRGKSDKADFLLQKGYTPEKAPNGNWSFNYSGLNVHRRGEWMVSAMGHSRYLWASEGYRGENLYGRYMNHGSLQILATGNPISNHGSGFRQEGWDWNHFPGTTATVLPMEQLKADVKNLDNLSGFEEMLLSDESFLGGISIGNQNGAFGMKLHEHDKYNGTLRARKSVFFFDNRVVALGSNIQSALPQETHTTLFQVFLENEKTPFFVNGMIKHQFPYHTLLKNENKNLLSDGLGNYFYVPKGEVIFKKELQHSLDEETGAPTQNNFALAAINHGSCPVNESYEYLIVIQPSQKEKELIHRDKFSTGSPYEVLQQDSLAHIVRDSETRTTGYILFEAGKINASQIVREVNLPSLAMIREIDPDKLILSASDPDLRFYEGASDEVYDAYGRRVEKSIYSREWIDNPSGISYLKMTLAGRWELGVTNRHARIVESGKDQTIIEFECQHGLSQEVLLFRR